MKQLEKFTTYNVNFRATGEYTLGVAEERFIPLGYSIIAENYNAVTAAPSSSIGYNSPSFNNIANLPSIGLASSITNGKVFTQFFNDQQVERVPKGSTIKLKISVAGSASSLNASIVLFGYYNLG